jgi:hypothetical protein
MDRTFSWIMRCLADWCSYVAQRQRGRQKNPNRQEWQENCFRLGIPFKDDAMQINQYLNDNIRTLIEAKAPVAFWLAQLGTDPLQVHERVFRNQAGLLDWRMENGLGLYEKLNPLVLYKDWLPQDMIEGGATVIVGAGIGYAVNHVLTGTPPSHKLLVVEPRPEMLLACLGQTDYRPFLQSGRLAFVPPDPNLVEKAVSTLDVSFLFSRINLRSDLASKQMGPEYARATQLVKAKLENLSVELSTLRHKQEIMVGNELRNYTRAMDGGSLARVKGMARGLTAVILGAGPSLPRFAPQLAALREKAFFATALQTLPVLERLGLKPDLCLAIDYSPEMLQCLHNLKDPNFAADIPFIYSTKMNPDVLANYPGPMIPLWTQGGIGTFMLKDQELVLDAGGNVGVTLERFLSWAGASRFILVGQDYAWQGETTHAQGHHAAAQAHPFQPTHDVRLTNLHGQEIYTSMGFLAAKRDIEKDILQTKLPFYNLYGDGVVIQGATSIDMDALRDGDLLASEGAAKEVFLDALRRAARPRVRPIFTPRAGDWSVSLKNAGRRLEKLMRKAAKHQDEIKGLLSQILFFLKKDPLYLPYIYNEIMDMAGLIQTRAYYGVKELTDFKAIRKRVMDKIKQIDETLGPSRDWAA